MNSGPHICCGNVIDKIKFSIRDNVSNKVLNGNDNKVVFEHIRKVETNIDDVVSVNMTNTNRIFVLYSEMKATSKQLEDSFELL